MQMMSSDPGSVPATISIDYVIENLDSATTVTDLSAVDDLTAVFGTHGVDWTFTSITSSANIVHNSGFNGHSDTELIEQTGGSEQDLAAGNLASVSVVIELLTIAGDTDMDGEFCSRIFATGTQGGLVVNDLSTNGPDPDPNGDASPDEAALSCLMQLPIELLSFSIV